MPSEKRDICNFAKSRFIEKNIKKEQNVVPTGHILFFNRFHLLKLIYTPGETLPVHREQYMEDLTYSIRLSPE